ncbi:MAG TPA: HPr kinase/phosphatase C-terminal domain-containing protein [Rhizomicrobium sp.]|jgi:serine kinase of HPr protein (carbohydrate metabolism regulator)
MTEANIHASCVALNGRAVLLVGASGAGKSDLTLRLIDSGAKLVADDRTVLFTKKGALHAKAPASIRGLIEIRGVGIVKFPVHASAPIMLVVRLGREGPRLPAQRTWRPPAPLIVNAPPPQIALDAHFASTPAKIRAALAAFSEGLFRDTFNTK